MRVVNYAGMLIVIMAMMIMLYIGTMDDILSLSPALRFMVEFFVALLLIFNGGYLLDDFHGLWGVGMLPGWVAVPLTVVAAVGIINAINLIDGVNGLSSGYCITACTMFGTLFYLSGDMKMTILAVVSVGALIPFFLHNVFGKTSKMFIGDGGTLVMGVVITVFVIETLRSGSACGAYVGPEVGLIPFSLAVLCIPVFDTLRVMFSRILRGTSPFRPDKTHLHHMFISLGASHAATMLAIVLLNTSVVFCWWALMEAGRFAFGAALCRRRDGAPGHVRAVSFPRMHLRHRTRLLRFMRRLGYRMHLSRTPTFIRIQKLVDRL